MFVCILGSIIRTGCLTPYVRSVRGSWENKVLHGCLCYCYLPLPRAVFEDRKYESDRSPRGMWQWFILQWPLTSALHPCMLSHTTPLVLKRSPQSLGPKIKWPDPAQPSSAQSNPASTMDPEFWDLFVRPMKNRWTERRRGRERRKERDSCKIFVKKNNSVTLPNYIYLSCLFLLGRPCDLSDCFVFIFHMIWSWMERKKTQGGFCTQWEGCDGIRGCAGVKEGNKLKFCVFDRFTVFFG